MYTIVGLGNPGSDYEETRHNTGKMALQVIEETGVKAKYIRQDTFMNKSGVAVAKVIKSKKSAEKLIVIHDDLDLPVGRMKISWDRGSGGHKGLESVIRALTTGAFIRVRIGIGKKADVEKHILGKFTPKEKLELKKVFKKVAEAVGAIMEHGLPRAMSEFNK